MLFLWKYIDDLIGKGFEWYVIAELMLYASATNVAMALPLSVLLSSIMTYGSLGENYELVAIKSAGISLTRAMYPMFVLVSILSVSAFFFSEYMLPKANLKYFSLLYDAREQKSANFLPENVFSNSFPNYTIRVKRKDADGQTLHDVIIYHKDPMGSDNYMMFAKQGKMYKSNDNKYLVMELKDGIRYSEAAAKGGYNERQTLTRFRFSETKTKFDLSGMGFTRRDESQFKGAFQMMNLRQLGDTMKLIDKNLDSSRITNYRLMSPYIKYLTMPSASRVKVYDKYTKPYMKTASRTELTASLAAASGEVRSIQEQIKNRNIAYKENSFSIHSAEVEYQKKFTLSAACLALFLIGAPLGAIIRKGGLGLPVVVAVVFFLIYYIISTIGEKAVKAGDASAFIGMWIAIVVLTPFGIFLSYKAANDSVIFDAEAYKRAFAKFFEPLKAKFVKKRLVAKD